MPGVAVGLANAVKQQEKDGDAEMKNGLYANIHAKRERIQRQKAAGKTPEQMRKPGSPGAPTSKAFVQSAQTAKKGKKQ